MNPKLALELFGYLGTALVLVSMLMTDIKWLRGINMAGGLISLIYAIFKGTMPVVVLNGSLIIINGVQLTRKIIEEKRRAKVNSCGDEAYNQTEKEKEDNI